MLLLHKSPGTQLRAHTDAEYADGVGFFAFKLLPSTVGRQQGSSCPSLPPVSCFRVGSCRTCWVASILLPYRGSRLINPEHVCARWPRPYPISHSWGRRSWSSLLLFLRAVGQGGTSRQVMLHVPGSILHSAEETGSECFRFSATTLLSSPAPNLRPEEFIRYGWQLPRVSPVRACRLLIRVG